MYIVSNRNDINRDVPVGVDSKFALVLGRLSLTAHITQAFRLRTERLNARGTQTDDSSDTNDATFIADNKNYRYTEHSTGA